MEGTDFKSLVMSCILCVWIKWNRLCLITECTHGYWEGNTGFLLQIIPQWARCFQEKKNQTSWKFIWKEPEVTFDGDWHIYLFLHNVFNSPIPVGNNKLTEEKLICTKKSVALIWLHRATKSSKSEFCFCKCDSRRMSTAQVLLSCLAPWK